MAAHDDGGRRNLGRVVDGQVGAHVDVGAVGHRIVECEHRLVVGFDQGGVDRVDLVAGVDRVDEFAADRAPRAGAPLRQLLGPFFERGAAFAGPYEGIEGEAAHPLGMALGEQRGAQRARRNTIDVQRAALVSRHDVVARDFEIVGAVGYGS